MKLRKTFCLLFSMLMITAVYSPNYTANAASSKADVKVVSKNEIENESFKLCADKSGAVSLFVKATGEYWHSNPVNEELNAQVTGINKMKMQSQLIVTYLVDEKNEKQATSCASATNKKGITVKATDKGIRIDYSFVKEEFTIPVLYSIDSKGMTAKILNSEIKEKGNNTITKIILLPYWGAASSQENGYFLVPDGSGALINFNNGKTASNYQQDIYNTDGLMNVESNVTTTEKAYMPIFGINREAQSALAVINGGESACKLYSFVSGTNGPYNNIYPEFTYRKSSVIQMLSKTWYPLEVTFVSKQCVKDESFSVKYIPILGDDKSYSGMANEYRDYLKTNLKFESRPKKDYVPVFLDIYGSVLVSDNFLGFPITVNKSLTDCDETQDIISELRDSGIDDIKVRYKGVTKAGLYNKKVPTKFKAARSIGGNNGFKDLLSFAKKNGTEIYPDFDFIYFKKNGNSIFQPNNVIQDVRHKNGIFYDYDISSGVAKKSDGVKYALKPERVQKAVNSFLKSYKKLEGGGLSLSTLGNNMFSDYGKDICLSYETQAKFEAVLKNISDSKVSTMLEAPYIYAAPYADCIIAAPGDSSNYDIEDKTVPFYQLTLHGLVSYSVPSMNFAADSKTAVLKAIETGSSVMYSLSAADYAEIIKDGYDELSCIYAEDWLFEIAESGKKVYSALKDVSSSEIIGHNEILHNVFKTKYGNGIVVYVNYNENDVIADGLTVKAMDFYVFGGEQN